MKSVILVSGMDSIVLLETLKREGLNPLPVYFKLGIPSEGLEIKNLPNGTVVHNFPEEFNFSDLSHEEGVVLDLLGRSTIMYLLLAKKYRPDVIYAGTLVRDSCYSEANNTSRYGLSCILSNMLEKNVSVSWPFVDKGYSKVDVIKKALSYEMDLDKLVSCHGSAPCGTCFKCVERVMACLDLGVPNDFDIAKLLTSGNITDEEIEKIYSYFKTRDTSEIFSKVGL